MRARMSIAVRKNDIFSIDFDLMNLCCIILCHSLKFTHFFPGPPLTPPPTLTKLRRHLLENFSHFCFQVGGGWHTQFFFFFFFFLLHHLSLSSPSLSSLPFSTPLQVRKKKGKYFPFFLFFPSLSSSSSLLLLSSPFSKKKKKKS